MKQFLPSNLRMKPDGLCLDKIKSLNFLRPKILICVGAKEGIFSLAQKPSQK
jgi:hypothetical protein